VRYRDLFKNREFTALYIADVVSTASSYLARIAVAALIYHRTHSTAWTAAAIAITYAPYLLSPWLSTPADRYARKLIVITSECGRGLFTAAILIGGLPVWTIIVLIFVVECFSVPFGAARLSLLTEIFTVTHFPTANAFVQSTRQVLQLGGFLAGGIITAAVGSYIAIAIDAVTYWLSALLLAFALKRRPAPQPEPAASEAEPARVQDAAGGTTGRSLEGLRLIAHSPRLRYLLLLLSLGPGVAVVTEGLAVPLAHELGHSTPLAGAIMAAGPLGNVVGLLATGRLSARRQLRFMVPSAITCATCVAAAGISAWLADAVPVVLLLITLSGVFLAYLNSLQGEIARMIPDHLRGRLFGLANAILQLAQGGAIVAAGVIATYADVGPSLIVVGGCGAFAVALVGGRMRRQSRPVRHAGH
jgi:MFS family permease